MVMGPAAFNALQQEQQQRAGAETPIALRRLGVAGGDALRLGGGVLSFMNDQLAPISPVGVVRDSVQTGIDLAKPSVMQAGTFANNVLGDYLNSQDERFDLGPGGRVMTPVPTRAQIQAKQAIAGGGGGGFNALPTQQIAPQPDALSGRAFAAPRPQAQPVAQTRQRAPQATNAAAPAMPPTPQERQKNLADIMATPETLEAVAKAGSVRGGKDEVIKTRRGFTPENLGMIAFGLTLMTGGDMNEALNNGLSVHGNLDQMRDEKQQRRASQELLKSVPKEYVPALNALIESKQFEKVADYAVGIEQDRQAVEREDAAAEAANARRAALAQQTAAVLGVSPDAISMMPPEKLAQMVVNQFDSNNAAALAQQKAALQAQAQAASTGDEDEARAYLAQFGVDAGMLKGDELQKQVTKFATGDFSSSQAETAGHAYIMATVLPRLDYLEQNYWQGDRVGFGTNRAAANEYRQLLEDLTLAVNRKDSGAAVAKTEFEKTERLYGFQTDKFFGANKASNAKSRENRRTKLKAFIAQTGGAYQHMIINSPIAYDADLTAGGVSMGSDFIPTPYEANPDGVEFVGPNNG